jgi:hypothetical protein
VQIILRDALRAAIGYRVDLPVGSDAVIQGEVAVGLF